MERLSLLIIVLRPFTGRAARARSSRTGATAVTTRLDPHSRQPNLVVPVYVELVDIDIPIACGAAGHE